MRCLPGRARRRPRPAAHVPRAGRRGRAAARRPRGLDQGARGDRLLPAAAAPAVRRARGRPDRLLHRGARHRLGLRLDRLGLQRGRRAPVAGRAVRRRGAAGGLGRGHRHPAELVVRARPARRCSPTAASRCRASGASPPAATTARGCCSAGWCSTRTARSSTSDLHGPAREVPDRRRLERRRPARHRLQRHRRRGRLHPRGVHALDGRDRPVQGPGPGGEHLRPLQAAVPLDLHQHDHHADHRHGAWAPTPSTSRCSRSGSARRTSARRPRSTRSPRSAIARASSEIDAAWALPINNIREEQALRRQGRADPARRCG